MNVVDWAIVVLAALLIPLGIRQGFIVGAITLAGFAAGAALGARIGPLLLPDGSDSPYAPATALLGGLILGGLLAILLEGVAIDFRDRIVRGRALTALDSLGGGVVLAALALVIAWVVGAVALNAPALKDHRGAFQSSAILSAVNDVFPPSGPLLNVLNRIDPVPEVEGPDADVAAPKARILKAPGVQSASASVVRVESEACGLNVSGSGWVAAPETVVTNAHVVAGSDSPVVISPDGAELSATAVAYRSRDDLAILSVPGLSLPALELDPDPRSGTPGAVAGYPGGGPFKTTPARLGTTGTVQSDDSYGQGPIEREMTSFRADVVAGNSGGPVIDAEGEVLTTVFASSLSSKKPEGLGIPNSVTRKALARIAGSPSPVGTGPCAA